jgi:hypothetical protein
MGKNISGVGIDTNIVGRIKIHGQEEPAKPKIKSIIVSDLTKESHGNATGVGLADVITRKLFAKIDFDRTKKNVTTSGFLERGKMPIIAETDDEALKLALRNCGSAVPGSEGIIRIKDTLHLDTLYVSNEILNKLEGNSNIEILQKNVDLLADRQAFAPFE